MFSIVATILYQKCVNISASLYGHLLWTSHLVELFSPYINIHLKMYVLKLLCQDNYTLGFYSSSMKVLNCVRTQKIPNSFSLVLIENLKPFIRREEIPEYNSGVGFLSVCLSVHPSIHPSIYLSLSIIFYTMWES